jgi:hypothetical protein
VEVVFPTDGWIGFVGGAADQIPYALGAAVLPVGVIFDDDLSYTRLFWVVGVVMGPGGF